MALITSTPADGLPVGLAEHLAGHWRIDDTLDAQQIAAAVTGLSRQLGPVDRLVGALEQLQEPLAVARQMLGIEGMDAQTARNVRDKARMKSVLRAAGVPCARHQLVHHPAEAVAFAEEVGFRSSPSRRRSRCAGDFSGPALRTAGVAASDPPRADSPGLLEEFLVGEEHTFDSVLDGRTVWSSIADYIPPPLEVLRNPWMQWVVMLPRDISGPEYAGIHEVGRPRSPRSACEMRSRTWSGSAARTVR